MDELNNNQSVVDTEVENEQENLQNDSIVALYNAFSISFFLLI